MLTPRPLLSALVAMLVAVAPLAVSGATTFPLSYAVSDYLNAQGQSVLDAHGQPATINYLRTCFSMNGEDIESVVDTGSVLPKAVFQNTPSTGPETCGPYGGSQTICGTVFPPSPISPCGSSSSSGVPSQFMAINPQTSSSLAAFTDGSTNAGVLGLNYFAPLAQPASFLSIDTCNKKLVLGDSGDAVPTGNSLGGYTTDKLGNYYVQVASFAFNSQAVQLDSTCQVDSGTPVIIMPKDLYQQLHSLVPDATDMTIEFSNGFKFSTTLKSGPVLISSVPGLCILGAPFFAQQQVIFSQNDIQVNGCAAVTGLSFADTDGAAKVSQPRSANRTPLIAALSGSLAGVALLAAVAVVAVRLRRSRRAGKELVLTHADDSEAAVGV